MNTTEPLSEAAIIERVLNGEKSLYELIVRRLNPHLYKVGRAYGYTHEDTQDLMQDTFVAAYKHLAQFRNEAQFKTWIISIMLHQCYRKKEKADFKYRSDKDLNENDQPMFPRASNDPGRNLYNKELGRIIESALLRLPEDYRLVFSLRELNKLSTAETATALSISDANVKVRLNRAKDMLRTELLKSYDPSELFEFNLIYCDAIVDKVMQRLHEE